MYFLFYFLIVILILLFIIIQFFNIISQSTDKEYKFYLNILLFVVVLSTIIGVVINIYSILKNNNKVGNMGDRGIEGEQGKDGTPGRCDIKCGQKVCYLNVVEHANKILRKEIQAISNSANLNSKIEIKGLILNNMNIRERKRKYMNFYNHLMFLRMDEKMVKHLDLFLLKQ